LSSNDDQRTISVDGGAVLWLIAHFAEYLVQQGLISRKGLCEFLDHRSGALPDDVRELVDGIIAGLRAPNARFSVVSGGKAGDTDEGPNAA
jgi:hypothetical protein